MKICTCTSCGGVYEDTNPTDESIEYPETPALELLPLENDNCPLCHDDLRLLDNIYPEFLNASSFHLIKMWTTAALVANEKFFQI